MKTDWHDKSEVGPSVCEDSSAVVVGKICETGKFESGNR